MKTHQSKWQKFSAGWLRRRTIVDKAIPEDVHPEQPQLLLSPLDRIRQELQRLGLGKQVRVRCETAGNGFVLEDDDGFVHAKDFASAVAMINRIWCYES